MGKTNREWNTGEWQDLSNSGTNKTYHEEISRNTASSQAREWLIARDYVCLKYTYLDYK